jgi:hypothetical protein
MLPRKTALTAALTAVALAAGMAPAAYAGPPTDKPAKADKPVKDTADDSYATGDGRKN